MAKIIRHRRCGNTTRQVDEWVQQLFEEGSALIIDHAHVEGYMANRNAERILFGRLKNEHGLEVGRNSNLQWDEKTRNLTLLSL